MKQRIFNRGKGWYILATNYRDENDKAYVNLYFPKNTEPNYVDNGRGFSTYDIDIIEAKFNSYEHKAEMVIFKYEIVNEKQEQKEEKYNQVQLNDGEKNMFGGNIKTEEELPFY